MNLTRNLGVNLAGVEIVLNMRDKMGRMQGQMNAFLEFFLDQLGRTGVSKEEVRQRALATIPKSSLQALLERLEEGDAREG